MVKVPLLLLFRICCWSPIAAFISNGPVQVSCYRNSDCANHLQVKQTQSVSNSLPVGGFVGDVRRPVSIKHVPTVSSLMVGLFFSVQVLLCSVAIAPEVAMATGFGPAGATMSPPRDVLQSNVRKAEYKYNRGTSRQYASLREGIETMSMEDLSHQLDSFVETQTLQQQQVKKVEKEKDLKIINAEDSAIQQEEEEVEAMKLQAREEYIQRLEAQPYWFDYLAAFIGSVGSTLIMHPMDTIKTRLQVRGANKNNGTSTSSDEFELLLTDNLYQGLTGNIWREGPSSALSLSVYEFVKLGLLRAAATTAGGPTGTATRFVFVLSRFQVYLLAGAAGELVGSVIQAPAEVIKSLLQSQAAETPTQALGIVVSKPEGVVRAWSAAIWRDVPFSAIQLAVFELLKACILNHPETFHGFDSTTLTGEALIGAFAGGCGALVTNPCDVVTARIITQQQQATPMVILEDTRGDDVNDAITTRSTAATTTDQNSLGVVQMVRLINSEGGLSAFFVGWQARVGYWAPAISIFLTTYCSI